MSDTTVRKARKDDMQSVIKLIKELAEFENMPDRVEIDAKILERDGFDVPSPLFYCYVAETSNLEIIGYALYFYHYSTWLGKSIYLEDLYVKPEYRKKGIGKKLFLVVAKEAYLCKTRLDFSVLAWNPAILFYEKLGAENLTKSEQWNSVRLDMMALTKLFDNKME